VLGDDRSGAARVLRAHGLTLPAARAALGRLAERGLVPGPRPSDAELLGTVGIDLDAVRAHEQARALGAGVIGPELLLLGVVADIKTPWPRCMNNRWRRQLHASVDLPRRYRGAAGPLLGAFGIDLDELAAALTAELQATVT
jgi:Clp amino terminal domain, pathogenicity island component